MNKLLRTECSVSTVTTASEETKHTIKKNITHQQQPPPPAIQGMYMINEKPTNQQEMNTCNINCKIRNKQFM